MDTPAAYPPFLGPNPREAPPWVTRVTLPPRQAPALHIPSIISIQYIGRVAESLRNHPPRRIIFRSGQIAVHPHQVIDAGGAKTETRESIPHDVS
jgi:hypothetical protein